MEPIICVGQQPSGILPKRFFLAKLHTARKLQQKIGGKIVWFCHDSDQDYRLTATKVPDAQPGAYVEVNFPYSNKIQKQWAPLAHKKVRKEEMSSIREILRTLAPRTVAAFDKVNANTAAEFCIQMYEHLGLLKDIMVVRSSEPSFRKKAETAGFPEGYFYDTIYEGELVRAQLLKGRLMLHQAADTYIDLGAVPELPIGEAISGGRDTRFEWMQSVIHCTHYITGKTEQEFLHEKAENAPAYIEREEIDRPDECWTPR